MTIRTLRSYLFCGLFLTSSVRLSPTHSDEPARIEILVERIERMSRDEVHFSLKVSNRSDRPVFLTGIKYESGPRLYPVYLEQWRMKEGWKRVCGTDMPPPDVLKLNPGEAITEVVGEAPYVSGL